MSVSVKFKSKTNSNALKEVIKKTVANSSFNISCPNCHTNFQIQGSQFDTHVICPSCHQSIFIDGDGFNNDLNKL